MLQKCLRARLRYYLAVHPPTPALQPLVRRADAALELAAKSILGWSDAEAQQVWRQSHLASSATWRGASAEFRGSSTSLAAISFGIAHANVHADIGVDMGRFEPVHAQVHLAAWLRGIDTGLVISNINTHDLGRLAQVHKSALRLLYAKCRSTDPTLPPNLTALLTRAHTQSEFHVSKVGTVDGGVRWQALLLDSWWTKQFAAWWNQASGTAKCRALASRGRWVYSEPPMLQVGYAKVTPSYERVTWRIAMRIRVGLDPRPALAEFNYPDVFFRECQNVYKTGAKAGDRCGTAHDADGRHALGCKVGGEVLGDHDMLRDLYVAAARPLYTSVRTEQYIHALVKPKPDGSMQEARMDVVARSAVSGTTLIDFRLSIPPRTASEGLLRHEELKYARYPVHVDGTRVTNAIFLPGVVSALGGVGPHLREYLANLEAEGRVNGRRSFASMSLVDFVSCHAVYLCAERVRNAFAADARRVGAAGTEGQA